MDHLITSTLFNEMDKFDLSKQMISLLEEKDPWKCFIIEFDFKQLIQSDPKIAKFFAKKPKTFIEKMRTSLLKHQNSLLNKQKTDHNDTTKPTKFGFLQPQINAQNFFQTKPKRSRQEQTQIKKNIQIIPKLPDTFDQEIESLLNPFHSQEGTAQEYSIQRDYREQLTILRGRVVRVSQPKMWEKLSLFECSECRQLQVVKNELNALADDQLVITCLADPESSSTNYKVWNRHNIQGGACQSKLKQKGEPVLGRFVEVHLEIESRSV